MVIAAKIADGMKAKGLSKKQLANLMDVYPSIVTRCIQGNHNFTVDTLVQLEHILKIQLIDKNL